MEFVRARTNLAARARYTKLSYGAAVDLAVPVYEARAGEGTPITAVPFSAGALQDQLPRDACCAHTLSRLQVPEQL